MSKSLDTLQGSKPSVPVADPPLPHTQPASAPPQRQQARVSSAPPHRSSRPAKHHSAATPYSRPTALHPASSSTTPPIQRTDSVIPPPTAPLQPTEPVPSTLPVPWPKCPLRRDDGSACTYTPINASMLKKLGAVKEHIKRQHPWHYIPCVGTDIVTIGRMMDTLATQTVEDKVKRAEWAQEQLDRGKGAPVHMGLWRDIVEGRR